MQRPPTSPSPRPPPPSVQFVERFRDTESDADADCELVEYATCLEIVRQFAQANRGHSANLRVTTSHCENMEIEQDCFAGCAFGSISGGTYRFLLPGVDDTFTKQRCKLSIHPRCACGNRPTPPPMLLGPPPPRAFTEDWNHVPIPNFESNGSPRDTSKGAVTAMVQRLVNGRSLDFSLRSGAMHAFSCPLEDDGRDTCARICSTNLLGRLRAFTVTGEK